VNLVLKKSALAIFLVAAAIALASFMITITVIHPINLVPNVVFAQNQTIATTTGPVVTNFTKLVQEQFSSTVPIEGLPKVPAIDVLYESPKRLSFER
jgi:hypothetical protein